MQSQPTNLEQSVLSKLECPVCKQYMVPPIMLCVNGHNICEVCKGKVTHCPTCKEEVLNTRNMALEDLATGVKYPCLYRKYGCKEIFSHVMIREHQNKCRYSPEECPLVKLDIEACSWTGRYSEIKKHLKEQHFAYCYDYVDGQKKLLSNVTVNGSYHKFVFAFNEIFFRRFDVRDNVFYAVVQYIGTADYAAKYKYKVTFVNKDNTESVTIEHLTRSFDEKLDDVYGSGNCGKLHYDVASRFKNKNGDVALKCEISRVAGFVNFF